MISKGSSYGSGNQINMRIVDEGNRLLLRLDRQVRKAEVYLGKQKLGEFGEGNRFDVTRYAVKAMGRPLRIVTHDDAGEQRSQKLQTMRTLKPERTPCSKAWLLNINEARRLCQTQGLHKTLVLPLVTGTCSGGAPQSDEFRFNVLKVDGDGRNKEVGDTIEIAVEFSTVPLGVAVRDDILFVSISNSEGLIYSNIYRSEGTSLPSLHLNLADRTDSVSGEYRITGMLMTDFLNGTDFVWYQTNTIQLYYGVEAPFVIAGYIFIGGNEPLDPPTDMDIPSDGIDRFRAFIDKHVVDPEEEFTITWEDYGSRSYWVHPTMVSHSPQGLVGKTSTFNPDDGERSFTTRAVDAFWVDYDEYNEEGELVTRMNDLDPEFFADKWVVLHYKVHTASNKISNTLIVYVRPPGSLRPTPPVLGIERCGDWLTDRDCGAGVYLCWHHSPEEAEGSFAIEKTFYETGGTRHWEHYQLRIPPSQRHLFVPISDFLTNNVNFRMRYSRVMPPDPADLEGEELEIVGPVFTEGVAYSLAEEDSTNSLYSNIVSMVSQPPPVLLIVYRDNRVCGNTISFNWTPVDKVDNYEYEVSDDPTFENSERVIREHRSAHAEDHEELYDDPEDYEATVDLFGPLELHGGIHLNGSILSDAEVIYVHVRSLVGWPPYAQRSNWSNVLYLRL